MALSVRDLTSTSRLIDRSGGRQRALVVLVAIAVGLAGAIHLALTDEQFRRGTAAGVIFLALGIYQILSGAALLVRPGPRAYRAGTWGSGLIVAAYVAAKVIPIPAAAIPPPISALGVTASVLDLAALILLATVLPETRDTRTRNGRIPAWRGGLAVGLAAPILWLFVTGALLWVNYDAFPVSPAPRLFWNPNRSGLITPALYGFVTDRVVTGWLYLFLPWWAGIGAALLGMLAGANVWLATRLRSDGRISCRRRRTGLLGLLPAAFAAPVCCGLPLGALFGLSTATLYAGAPFATAAALGLLTWNVLTLDRIRRAGVACDCGSEPTDHGVTHRG